MRFAILGTAKRNAATKRKTMLRFARPPFYVLSIIRAVYPEHTQLELSNSNWLERAVIGRY